jgi:hypothetical protein
MPESWVVVGYFLRVSIEIFSPYQSALINSRWQLGIKRLGFFRQRHEFLSHWFG